MPNDERRHFWVPTANVRQRPVQRGQGGEPAYVRPDYRQHGTELLGDFERLQFVSGIRRDAELTRDYIFQLRTPPNVAVKKHKVRLADAGIKVLAYSTKTESAATVKVPKRRFPELFGRVRQYAETPDNVGRSYLSVIEHVAEVPVEEKLDAALTLDMDGPIDCIVSLYHDLTATEKQDVLRSVHEMLTARGVRHPHIQNLLSGTATVVASLTPPVIRELGEAYLSVRSITPNPEASVGRAFVSEALPEGCLVNQPTTKQIVAVVVPA